MNSWLKISRHKKSLVVGGSMLAVIVTIFLMASTAPDEPTVMMKFLRTTNTAQGLMCVFQVDNSLADSLTTHGGFYQADRSQGFALRPEDVPAAFISSVVSITAQSTNAIEVMMPTNSGSYRLILPWRPASKATPTYMNSMGLRAKFWWAKMSRASPERRNQSLGWIYVASDTFDLSMSPSVAP